MITATSWLSLAFLTLGDAPKDYPRPDLLLEPSELASPKIVKRFIILDARPKAAYAKSHLKNAVRVDHEAWSKAFYKSQEPKEWAARIGALGIGNEGHVVIYDDAAQKDAARIWYILRYFGVPDVRLLDGGFKFAKDEGLPLEKTDRAAKPATFTLAPERERLAMREDILKLLKEGKTQIIDARSEKEFCGDAKLKNKRGGAIPGAMNLEWTEAIDKKTGRFKSAHQLAGIFKKVGIDPTKPAVTHCQSGGRAAVMAFTLELMGGTRVANYYRGWSEWSADDENPIVLPKKEK